MLSLLSSLVAALLLVNLVALGTSRISTVVRAVASQGVLLGALAVAAQGRLNATVVALALASIVLKGWLIPIILFRALRQMAIKREVEPSLGLLPSLLLGALATVLAVAAGNRLPLAETRLAPLLIPASLATVACGFIRFTRTTVTGAAATTAASCSRTAFMLENVTKCQKPRRKRRDEVRTTASGSNGTRPILRSLKRKSASSPIVGTARL